IPKAPFVANEEFARRVHPDDLPAVDAAVQRSIQDKKQEFFTFRILRPAGVIRYVSVSIDVIMDEHGTVVRVVGTCLDITERKRTEAQLRNFSQLLSLAMQSPSIVILDRYLGNHHLISFPTRRSSDLIPKAPFVANEEFARRVHPDDLPAVDAAVQRSIRDK